MKYLCLFLITTFSYFLKAQCTMSMTVPITPATCSTCCNGSATVTGASCPILSYTWVPGGTTGSSAANLCAGTTYTIYAYVQSTVCCGTPVATSTVFIPAFPTSVAETNSFTNKINVFPNPNNGSFKLQISNAIETGSLILINSLGQKVHEQNISHGQNNINTCALSSGLYNYIILRDKEQIGSGKLTIE